MSTIHLRIEVDAVGYSNEHVAVGDAVILGHAHADAVASRVDHGLEVAGGVNPIVDSVLGGVSCAGEHGEVVTEAVGIAGIGSGLALLQSVMPGVCRLEQTWAAFIRASLTGSSEIPLALRVWLMSQIISWRISQLSVRLVLSPSDGVSGIVGVVELTVSVILPHSPVLLEAVISALPFALAMATQKVSTCSTAIVSGSLEMTV